MLSGLWSVAYPLPLKLELYCGTYACAERPRNLPERPGWAVSPATKSGDVIRGLFPNAENRIPVVMVHVLSPIHPASVVVTRCSNELEQMQYSALCVTYYYTVCSFSKSSRELYRSTSEAQTQLWGEASRLAQSERVVQAEVFSHRFIWQKFPKAERYQKGQNNSMFDTTSEEHFDMHQGWAD